MQFPRWSVHLAKRTTNNNWSTYNGYEFFYQMLLSTFAFVSNCCFGIFFLIHLVHRYRWIRLWTTFVSHVVRSPFYCKSKRLSSNIVTANVVFGFGRHIQQTAFCNASSLRTWTVSCRNHNWTQRQRRPTAFQKHINHFIFIRLINHTIICIAKQIGRCC